MLILEKSFLKASVLATVRDNSGTSYHVTVVSPHMEKEHVVRVFMPNPDQEGWETISKSNTEIDFLSDEPTDEDRLPIVRAALDAAVEVHRTFYPDFIAGTDVQQLFMDDTEIWN